MDVLCMEMTKCYSKLWAIFVYFYLTNAYEETTIFFKLTMNMAFFFVEMNLKEIK